MCLEALFGRSLEECGRYLETIKMYENKPADLKKGQMDTDYLSRSLCNIMDASMEDLSHCPGIGAHKFLCHECAQELRLLPSTHPQCHQAIEELMEIKINKG